VAAAALGRGVGVPDAEPAAHEVLDEVDLAAAQQRPRTLVDDDAHAVRLEHLVAFEALVVDLHPVLVAAAPARLHEDAHGGAREAAAGEQLAGAAGAGLGERDLFQFESASLHAATYSTRLASLPVAVAAPRARAPGRAVYSVFGRSVRPQVDRGGIAQSVERRSPKP